jgi:hypothetical protein
VEAKWFASVVDIDLPSRKIDFIPFIDLDLSRFQPRKFSKKDLDKCMKVAIVCNFLNCFSIDRTFVCFSETLNSTVAAYFMSFVNVRDVARCMER